MAKKLKGKIMIRLILLCFIFVGCKSTTCESLGLRTKSAVLFVGKINSDTKEIVRYQCVPK